MSDTSEIAFTTDIAQLVADDLGVSKKKALEHIDFTVHWIKTITKNPKALNIYIPNVGYLYLNMSKVERDFNYFNNLSKGSLTPSWLTRLENQKVRLEEFNKQFSTSVGYNRHKKKSKFSNNWFNKGMTLQELEDWQNQ